MKHKLSSRLRPISNEKTLLQNKVPEHVTGDELRNTVKSTITPEYIDKCILKLIKKSKKEAKRGRNRACIPAFKYSAETLNSYVIPNLKEYFLDLGFRNLSIMYNPFGQCLIVLEW